MTPTKIPSRATSPDHGDAAFLLTQTLHSADATRNSAHFLRIVEAKNIVEYEDRRFTSKEAQDVARHLERYFAWVQSLLQDEPD